MPFLIGPPRRYRLDLTGFEATNVAKDVRIMRIEGPDCDPACLYWVGPKIPAPRRDFFWRILTG
jgi:hypothetical protein